MKKYLLSPISYLLSPICRSGGRSRRNGFTLIEMLVVIVIIVILMGVVFRMSRGVMATNLIAKERATIQVWKSLIEEFYDEYGCYPPVPAYSAPAEFHGKVQPIEYHGPLPFPDGDSKGDLDFYLGNDGKEKCQKIKIRHNNDWVNVTDDDGVDVFVFGLSSFFVNRANIANWVFSVIKDDNDSRYKDKVSIPWTRVNDEVVDGLPVTSEREKAFLKRLKPLRERIDKYHESVAYATLLKLTDNDDSLLTDAVLDPDEKRPVRFSVRPTDTWENDYVYISEPPYSSYLFFSQGPDGQYDTEFPDDPTRPKNRDNIYGTLADK